MESIRTLQASRPSTSSSCDTPTSSPQRRRDYSALPRLPLVPPQPFRATTSTSALPSPTSARNQARSSLTECSPLLPSNTRSPYPSNQDGTPSPEAAAEAAEAGGTILGIHNLSIVAPQFLVALISAGIFKILSLARSAPSLFLVGEAGDATNDVVWVLRFGGLAAAVGCVVSRWVLETESAKAYQEWVLRGPDEDHGEGEPGDWEEEGRRP